MQNTHFMRVIMSQPCSRNLLRLTATSAATELSHLMEFWWYHLSSLLEDAQQGARVLGVCMRKKRVRYARRTSSPRAPDTVHIVFASSRHVIVYNHLDVLDVCRKGGKCGDTEQKGRPGGNTQQTTNHTRAPAHHDGGRVRFRDRCIGPITE